MDYEKKYKEALEKARQLCVYPTSKPFISDLQDLFPELIESEDERIRKELINYLITDEDNGVPKVGQIPIDNVITWLEKQGEQKPTDKVEPKFKVGDWIVSGQEVTQIREIAGDRYIHSHDGFISFEIEKYYHLWSIQDARVGDILIYNDSIFIFNEICKNNLIYYCIYEHNKFHSVKYFSSLDLNTIDINNIHPATKEQRDTLEKAMADTGYTFNFEKKELKKIEQESAWSEGDNAYKLFALSAVEYYYDEENPLRKGIINWLNSLKQRINND